jgi:signal transduction histidine kinase
MRAKKCLGESLKQSAKLNENLIRQLQCIVGKDDEVVEAMDQQPTKICLLDYPSSNYELMYDYGDNLMLAGRQRQLYFM